MIRSLYTSASGMKAQQLLVDTISNNIANANTTAFKSDRVEFKDLIYQQLKDPDIRKHSENERVLGVQIGLGVEPVGTKKDFSIGSPLQTENQLDVMINGEGFFQIYMPDGTIAYTRDGSFNLSADGTLVTSDGYRLEPEIVIPEGVKEIEITEDGYVNVKYSNNEDETETVGRIELANFINPAGLKNIGSNLYVETIASGEPIIEYPGDTTTGLLKQGYLEQSNVKVIDQVVSLIGAQRTYELNSRTIQASDEMLNIVAQMKR